MDHLKEYVKEWMAFYESEGAFNEGMSEEAKFEIVMEDVTSQVNDYRYNEFNKDED